MIRTRSILEYSRPYLKSFLSKSETDSVTDYLEVDVVGEEVFEAVIRLFLDERDRKQLLLLYETSPVRLNRGRHERTRRILLDIVVVRSLLYRAPPVRRSLAFIVTRDPFVLLGGRVRDLLVPAGLSSKHLDDNWLLGRLEATHGVLVTRIRDVLPVHLKKREARPLCYSLFAIRTYTRASLCRESTGSVDQQPAPNRTWTVPLAREMHQKYDNHRGKSSNVRGSVLATDERITTGGLIFLHLPPAAH